MSIYANINIKNQLWKTECEQTTGLTNWNKKKRRRRKRRRRKNYLITCATTTSYRFYLKSVLAAPPSYTKYIVVAVKSFRFHTSSWLVGHWNTVESHRYLKYRRVTRFELADRTLLIRLENSTLFWFLRKTFSTHRKQKRKASFCADDSRRFSLADFWTSCCCSCFSDSLKPQFIFSDHSNLSRR